MSRRRAAIALLCLTLALPATALAHAGGLPTLIVPVDVIKPGDSFPVIGQDLGSDAVVILHMYRDDFSAELGTATAGPDGHFSTTVTLPAEYPTGPADLVADGDDGSYAILELTIGESRGLLWKDPAVLLLIAVLVGGAVIVGWSLLAARRREAAVRVAAKRRPARTARKRRR